MFPPPFFLMQMKNSSQPLQLFEASGTACIFFSLAPRLVGHLSNRMGSKKNRTGLRKERVVKLTYTLLLTLLKVD